MFVKQVYRSANTSILEHVFNSNNYNNNNNNNNNFFAHWYFIPRDLEISKV